MSCLLATTFSTIGIVMLRAGFSLWGDFRPSLSCAKSPLSASASRPPSFSSSDGPDWIIHGGTVSLSLSVCHGSGEENLLCVCVAGCNRRRRGRGRSSSGMDFVIINRQQRILKIDSIRMRFQLDFEFQHVVWFSIYWFPRRIVAGALLHQII